MSRALSSVDRPAYLRQFPVMTRSISRFARSAAVTIGAAGVMVATHAAAAPSNLAMAEAIWRLRAALNVAALQCQFDPELKIVERYNAFLKHHGAEISSARQRLVSTSGGEAAFDRYNTRTYNSFSAFENQVPFCHKASQVSEASLALPASRLRDLAPQAIGEIAAFFPTPPVPLPVKVAAAAPKKKRVAK